MSGNAWEWTNSWFNKKRMSRSLRGSSWNIDRVLAGYADHYGETPNVYAGNIGFRVLSPGA